MSKSQLQREIQQSRPFRSDSEEAALALVRTADQVQRALSEVIAPFGITLQQYNVLRILRGAVPQSLPTLEIAARMVEQAPGITRLLDRLEQKGLIARERGKQDRRCVYCSIRPAGLALLDRLEATTLAAADGCFAHLEPGTIRRLVSLLDAVRNTNPDPQEGPKGELP